MTKRSISDHSIFGEYKKTEDRVTAALLQVINEGGQMVVERLFGDMFDIPSNTINAIPQSYQGNSNPDGELSCDCKYNIFVESKIVPNAIKEEQLKHHLELTNPAESRFLVYITPDTLKPQILQSLNVDWMCWNDVVERLLGIIADGLAWDLLKYLIKQFELLVKHVVSHKIEDAELDGAIDDNVDNVDGYEDPEKNERVIIVGGHWGEEVAKDYGFYACQPNRYFKPAQYIAFYHQHRIKYLFEIKDAPIESTDLRKVSYVTSSSYLSKKEPHYAGDHRKCFRLELVQEFNPVIMNDKLDKNNNLCAFLQRQTYTTYDRIIKASKTSQL